MYQNEFFDKDGYLEKVIKLASIESKLINPTLEEITKFSGGVINERGEDLAILATANLAIAEDFHVGENVIAIAGDAKNVSGMVKSISNGIVTVIPDKIFNFDAFQYPARDLSKQFKEGHHVKVANGLHKDETGLVVKVDENVVTILSDASMKPIQVFSKDLRSAAEISTSQTSTGQYDIQDLVTLS